MHISWNLLHSEQLISHVAFFTQDHRPKVLRDAAAALQLKWQRQHDEDRSRTAKHQQRRTLAERLAGQKAPGPGVQTERMHIWKLTWEPSGKHCAAGLQQGAHFSVLSQPLCHATYPERGQAAACGFSHLAADHVTMGFRGCCSAAALLVRSGVCHGHYTAVPAKHCCTAWCAVSFATAIACKAVLCRPAPVALAAMLLPLPKGQRHAADPRDGATAATQNSPLGASPMEVDTAPQPVPPVAKAGSVPLAIEVSTVKGHHGMLKRDHGW